MDTMKFKAVMDYEGYPEHYGSTWKTVEPFISEMYVMAYNVYALKFSWEPVNAEWDRMYPDIVRMEEGTPEWTAYNKFASECATAWIEDNINKILMANLPMRFYVDEEEVVFTGYDVLHPECKVRMHLEEF